MNLEMTASPDKNAPRGNFAKPAKVPRESALGRARLRGWNDYRDGLPFRPSYDTWSTRKQYAYERGRHQAALTKAARPDVKLPLWRLDELVDMVIRRHLGDWAVADRIIEETRMARARADKPKPKGAR